MNIRTAVLKSEIFIEYLDVANDDVEDVKCLMYNL